MDFEETWAIPFVSRDEPEVGVAAAGVEGFASGYTKVDKTLNGLPTRRW